MSVGNTGTPTGFGDLDAEELYRSAVEDFALAISDEEKGSKKLLEAAFLESNVTWADYVAQHPEVAPEPAVVKAADVTVTPQVTLEPVVEEPEEVVEIITASKPKPNVKQKYLMKMTRKNPRFDLNGGIKFTRENPYALVDEATADYLLTKEDGFRQATPNELREFYS